MYPPIPKALSLRAPVKMDQDYLSEDNLKKLRQEGTPHPAPHVRRQSKSPRIYGQFLRGPISLDWISIAAKLQGKAPLALALVIRFESGRQNSDTVKLTNPLAEKLGVSRKAKYAGLKALEAAGL